jgi:hypothetical protein
LYPARFRAEYADEMQSVFAQMVLEHGDTLSLIGLMAGELWDLPASLLREYQQERRLSLQGGTIMAARVIPTWAFRLLVGTLVGIFILYCALILLPYYSNGLNTISWNMLMGGLYDPKNFAPFVYDGFVGIVTRLVGILVLLTGPIIVVVMGGVLTLTLLRHWQALRQDQRIWGMAGMLAGVFLLALMFSPFGYALRIWFMD